MNIKQFDFHFEEYESDDQLKEEDYQILQKARKATQQAYAPYSGFLVGAAAILVNGETITGSNQENASFPAGICAERSLLASAAQFFPNVAIQTIAVSYNNLKGKSNKPISPCGFCRQVMTEYETRLSISMRLILSGLKGEVYIIPSVSILLPLAFHLDPFDQEMNT